MPLDELFDTETKVVMGTSQSDSGEVQTDKLPFDNLNCSHYSRGFGLSEALLMPIIIYASQDRMYK